MIRCYTEFPLEATKVNATWEHDGAVWSSTFKREGHLWSRYRPGDDMWEAVRPHPTAHIPNCPTIYLVSE